MKYTPDDVHEVFKDVFKLVCGLLTTTRRRTRQGNWVTLQPITPDLNKYAIQFPFVCEQGFIFGQVGSSTVLDVLMDDIPTCGHHTDTDRDFLVARMAHGPGTQLHTCRRHPVIEPDLLAAFRIGGADAVASQLTGSGFKPVRKRAFNEAVYASQQSMLREFGLIMKQHKEYHRKLRDFSAQSVPISAPREPKQAFRYMVHDGRSKGKTFTLLLPPRLI